MTFETKLAEAYADLFKNDPDYAYSASRCTPEGLAAKMTAGLRTGAANHDGAGIKRACKAVGIKHTHKAIREYLATEAPTP
jgi:hypothetical protein